MTLLRTASRTLSVLAAAALLGLAGCGEDDVERNVEEGAKETRDAARDAKKTGEDAARDAKKTGEDAAREAEKQAKEAERDVEN